MLNNYLPKYFNRNARNYELKKQKLNICEYESNLIKKYGIPLLRNEVYEYKLFYAVSIIPEYDIRRIKLGITNNPIQRLKYYRSTSPNASYFDLWPCKSSWEKSIIWEVGRGSKQLSAELFEFDSLSKLKSDIEYSISRRIDNYWKILYEKASKMDIPSEYFLQVE